MMQQQNYDVAIVGGGNVGLTLALALAQKTSLSILLLEAQPEPPHWHEAHHYHRVSAISLSSKRIFQSLGVWGDISRMRASAFEKIAIWDVQGGAMQFAAQEVAEPILGYIIENQAMQTALFNKLAGYAQVTYLSGKQLESYRVTPKYAALTTVDGATFHARLVVAADGARSWLREQAGIGCERHDYHQTAIVATVTTASSHLQTARQLFLETGPIGFLPLINSMQSSIVWSLPSTLAADYMAKDDEAFRQSLLAVCSQRIGDITHVGERYQYPLAKQEAQQYSLPRLALIGDAAHLVHPLAGQGVNLGLLDAASLADIMIETTKSRRDIGGISALRRYERWRKGDNLMMLQGVDMIKNLFAVEQSGLQRLRAVGMQTVNQFSWAKNIFIRHAVGNRDGLPTLAKR